MTAAAGCIDDVDFLSVINPGALESSGSRHSWACRHIGTVPLEELGVHISLSLLPSVPAAAVAAAVCRRYTASGRRRR